MASTTGPPAATSPQASIGARYAQRAPPSPANRSTEAARARTLRRDKDNFSALQDRSKKVTTQGPYKIRPPVKISTKTIDTDTIGRVNKGNQKMSQFLYNLANEPSVGLFHVNDHVRRTVPRLVDTRKQIDFQSVELDKSSCDVDEILPSVKTIGSLTAFKSMQSVLLKTLQMAAPRPSTPSSSSSQRSLGPPTPNRTSLPPSPGGSQRNLDSPSPIVSSPPLAPESQKSPTSDVETAVDHQQDPEEAAREEVEVPSMVDTSEPLIPLDQSTSDIQTVREEVLEASTHPAEHEQALEELEINPSNTLVQDPELPPTSPTSDHLSTDVEIMPSTVQVIPQEDSIPAELLEETQSTVEVPLNQSGPIAQSDALPGSPMPEASIEASAQVDTSAESASSTLSSVDPSSEASVSHPPQNDPIIVPAAVPKGQSKKKKKGGAKAQEQSDLQPKAF